MTMIKKNVSEIEEEIRLHGHVEWRSKKNLDDYVSNNEFKNDICIVGYITPKTIQKWDLDLHRETPTAGKPHNFYVGVRNNRICYLLGLGVPLSNLRDYECQWKPLCSMCRR